MKCRTGVVRGEALLSYSFPPPHPFTSDRVKAFWTKLDRSALKIELLRPQQAGRDLIALFHSEAHINYVKMASDLGYGHLDQGDTPAFRGVYEAAQFTVGSTISCVEKVMEGQLDHTFNPLGGLHHATRDASAGFCVFNDIGVAIEVLRKNYKIRRILYVDIDVHHGDGVFYAYESDPEVYIFDLHEDGRYLYPGTGSQSETGLGAAVGTKMNVPLAPGSGDASVKQNLAKLQEFVDKAKPEFIIFQCGADGLAGDPIAGLNYSAETHRMVGKLLHRAAHIHSKGRIVALGGGGYKPENCAAAWCAVVGALAQSRSSLVKK